MTAPTADPELKPRVDHVVFATGVLSAFGKPRFSTFARKTDSGKTITVHKYENVPVFRSGEFADSLGRMKEWMPEQMSAMVANYDKLKADGNFTHVPVRKGHPSMFDSSGDIMDNVIGYISSLRTEVRPSPLAGDDEEYTFLIADYEILDETAQGKIDSGLFVNRSAEIGMYPTNAPVKEYWPAFMGVAYVDIPAVEGLNHSSPAEAISAFAKQHHSDRYSIQMEVPPMTDSLPKPKLGDDNKAEFTIGGVATTDFARVQSHIAKVEAENANYAAQVSTLTNENTTLKQFKVATENDARDQFVTSLSQAINGEAPKLPAPRLDAEIAFARSLSDEQFTAYKARWDDTPGQTIFNKVGSSGDDGHRPAESAPAHTEADTLKAVVKNLRDHSKMAPEAIMQTSAFSKLLAIEPTVTLASL